jgi:hypothetical protein
VGGSNLTEELAARMPLAIQQPQAFGLGHANGGMGGSGLLAMLSPGALQSPTGTSPMDLTDGAASNDGVGNAGIKLLGSSDDGLTPTAELLAGAVAGTATHDQRELHDQQHQRANITSMVPQLSTLVEEDEDATVSAGGVGLGDGAGTLLQQPATHSVPLAGQDVTVSMELTLPASAVESSALSRQGSVEEVLGGVGGGAVNAGAMGGAHPEPPPGTPPSPFALNEMMRGHAAVGEPAAAPAATRYGGDVSPFAVGRGLISGLAGATAAAADPVDEGVGLLRDKWGFAPGADDTLDVSHGAFVHKARKHERTPGQAHFCQGSCSCFAACDSQQTSPWTNALWICML